MREAFLGGILIGLAVSVMLVFNGRVTGISGIIQGSLFESDGKFWRISLLLGLILGGLTLSILNPELVSQTYTIEKWRYPVAGILVGFGTLLGSGCTSGHGVCGISRLSVRSILATMSFIGFGILTVFILRMFGVTV